MNMKRSGLVLLSVLVLFVAFPAWAENPHCEQVGGVLMTNIGSIPFGPHGVTNLGPVFGDLAGSVAATPIAPPGVGFHHYWVTSSGDTINFKDALLNADPMDLLEGGSVVAVRWGHYISEIIPGGTGKFANATGKLEYFGLADFNQNTLVLRYRGEVCYGSTNANTSKK